MQMTDLKDPQAYTAQEHAVELAEEQICTAERFGGWLQSVDDVRHMSATWGMIGNAELVTLALSRWSVPEQTHAAIRTLRRRFLAEHCEEIAQTVANLMQEVNHD